MTFPKQNSLLWHLSYGPKYFPFWPKKPPQVHSQELWLHVFILLLSGLVPSFCVTLAHWECAWWRHQTPECCGCGDGRQPRQPGWGSHQGTDSVVRIQWLFSLFPTKLLLFSGVRYFSNKHQKMVWETDTFYSLKGEGKYASQWKLRFLLKTSFGEMKSPNHTAQSTQFPCVSIHSSFPSQSPNHSLPVWYMLTWELNRWEVRMLLL